MSGKLKFLVLFLAMLLVALSAAGTVAAEKLVIYSSVDEENARNILDQFSKDTGVEYQMVFLSSGPALSRIEAEKGNPQADVWFGAPNENHIVAKERGLTQPYCPAMTKDLAANFYDTEGYWHAFYMNPLAFGLLPEDLEADNAKAPGSWDDLLDPSLKGMIQMPSPQSSGTAFGIMMTLITIKGEDQAFEFMKKMTPNVQTYTQSGTGPAKNLAIRETALGIQFSPAFLKLASEGFPIKVVFPKEGVGYEAAALSILKDSAHPKMAHKLVDWILSKEGQETLVAQKTYFFPVRPDVAAGEGVPSLSEIKLIDFDREKAAADKSRLVERWVQEVLSQ